MSKPCNGNGLLSKFLCMDYIYCNENRPTQWAKRKKKKKSKEKKVTTAE